MAITYTYDEIGHPHATPHAERWQLCAEQLHSTGELLQLIADLPIGEITPALFDLILVTLPNLVDIQRVSCSGQSEDIAIEAWIFKSSENAMLLYDLLTRLNIQRKNTVTTAGHVPTV